MIGRFILCGFADIRCWLTLTLLLFIKAGAPFRCISVCLVSQCEFLDAPPGHRQPGVILLESPEPCLLHRK
jgi:hypothetical protein